MNIGIAKLIKKYGKIDKIIIINSNKFLETTITFALLDKEFIDFFILFKLSITDIN